MSLQGGENKVAEDKDIKKAPTQRGQSAQDNQNAAAASSDAIQAKAEKIALKHRIRDTLIYLLIFACVISIVVSQIYVFFSSESDTEDALMFTARSSIDFTGVIIRDESLVYSQYAGDGVLNYCVDDGSRLSKNSQIATIYDSYDQIYYRYEIDRIEEELDAIESAQNRGTTDYVQPEFISSQISESYKTLLSEIVSGNLTQMNSDKLDMLKLMCIYNVSSNIESDYSQRITQLSTQLQSYEKALVNPVSEITAVESGYFTSVVDGYETELSIDQIPSLTVEIIEQIIASPVKEGTRDSNVIGKVFSDYTWKMVGIIDTPDRYFVNQSFDLLFSSFEKSYHATVESIVPTGNGNEAIIVISCDEMDADIAASRVLDAQILFGEYTGIRVPRSAIRFVGEDRGVYVLEGEELIFKKLNVIYEGDDFVLSEYNAESEYLQLYDRMLLDPVPTSNGANASTANDDSATDETDDTTASTSAAANEETADEDLTSAQSGSD